MGNRPVKLVGGPLDGRWIDVPPESCEYHVLEVRPPHVNEPGKPVYQPANREAVYRGRGGKMRFCGYVD